MLFLGSKAVSANIYAELQRMDSCPCFHSFLSNCFLLQPVFLNYNCYIELCSPAQVGSPSSARSGFWSWPTFRTLRWSYTGWSGPRCFSLLPSSSWWRCFIWTIKKNAEWQHTRNIHNLWKMAFSTRLFPKIIIFFPVIDVLGSGPAAAHRLHRWADGLAYQSKYFEARLHYSERTTNTSLQTKKTLFRE